MLAQVSALRGIHSTGMFTVYDDPVDKSMRVASFKDAVDSNVFVNEQPVKELFDLDTAIVHAGHCRHATVGLINEANAHPFKEGHVIGMHNGTIPTISHPDIKEKDIPDSRHVFRYISEIGLEKTLGHVWSGAYALCWVDTKEKTLNFIRNGERPLYFMKKNDGTLFWASESIFLTLIKVRTAGVNLFDTPEILPVDVHLSIDLETLTTKVKEKIKPDYTHKYPPLSFRPEAPTRSVAVAPQHNRAKDLAHAFGAPAILKDDNTSGQYEGYIGFQKKRMKLSKARGLLKQGCAFKPDHALTIYDKVHWFNHKQCLCDACANDDSVLSFMHIKDLYPGRLIPTKRKGI